MRNKEQQLSYLRGQLDISKLYAMYWHGMATTGAATLKKTAQGREVTEEEKAQGQVIGWREHTDQEKVARALETMKTHIHRMNDILDEIDELNSEAQKET